MQKLVWGLLYVGLIIAFSMVLMGIRKKKGVKRHVVVDKNGFLLAVVMVTIACVHDSKAVYLLTRNLRELCCNIKIILSDAGYRGEIADKIK